MGKDGSCERIMPLGLRERGGGGGDREREHVRLNYVIGDRVNDAGCHGNEHCHWRQKGRGIWRPFMAMNTDIGGRKREGYGDSSWQ
jgi:hypothetical protein